MKLQLLWILACSVSLTATAAEPPASTTEQSAAAAHPAHTHEVVVYKNAGCGCCKVWVEHLRQHGFRIQANDVDNLQPVKERVGVPFGMGSCHTAEVGGYFIEGHVPAADVLRLLREKPKGKGLTVPGMPIGSPGMEQGERIDPYEVHLVHEDGTTSVYARYPQEVETQQRTNETPASRL